MFLATHPPCKLFQKLLFALLALGILAGAHKHTLASAPIGDDLEAVLRITPSNQPIEVVVTFWERAGIGLLDGLSVPYLPLKVLPMAGAYMTPEQIAAARNWPEVRSIHYNAPLEFYIRESVPLTGAPQVWAQGETGQNVTIAVLDTGIDGTHPDLAFPNKTIAQVKFIHTKYASWAHGNNTETVGLFVEGVPQTDTTSGHGSHVAGIAAGAGAADPAFKGMAPGAKLVGLGAGDDFFVYEALKGFDWLFIRDSNGIPNHQKYNIRVVNNSWGGGGGLELRVNHPIVLATYEAYKAGINVVFAAGNSGPTPDTFNFYALPPWNIGVASTDKVPSLSGFSSRGYPNHPFKLPTVSAPGSGIQAANFYAWAAAPQTTKSGTSMASPHVAGLVALLVSANPKLSPDQVQEILRSGTRSMDLQAWQAGAGFIDAAAAYALARNIAGNLDPFLAGQQAHSPESADATPLPYQRVEFEWSNTLGPSAGVLVSRQDQPFTVHDQTEFLSVFVEWDRTAEDLDLILTSPTGKVHRSPTGIVDRALGPLGAGKTIGAAKLVRAAGACRSFA